MLQAWCRRAILVLCSLALCAGVVLAAAPEPSKADVARAAQRRQALLRNALDPFLIQAEYTTALEAAETYWKAGQTDEALAALETLKKYAPLTELPFIKAQLLLAAIAEFPAHGARNLPLRDRHRLFAAALVRSIDASGDGLTPRTAFKLVLSREADGWLLANGERLQPLDKRVWTADGNSYDIWRVRLSDGTERELYFDVTGMLRKPAAKGAGTKNLTAPVQKNQTR